MDAYGGVDLQVGEIRALRTFRIGPGGILYPLFSDRAWTPGTNTASCRVLQPADRELTWSAPHSAPDDDCGCGFYAYADDAGPGEYPQSQHVLAVIACWGHVIAGTRGIRAQYARIEALWMSPRVPDELKEAVANHYPDVAVYESRPAMTSDHPPTVLDCYEIPTVRQRSLRRRALQVAMIGALAVGSLPAGWIWHNHNARLIWGAELGFFLLAALFLRVTARDLRTRGSALLYAAVTLWLIAPFAGGAGIFLLRLPILQIAVVGRLYRARLNREASRFPASITSG